MLGKFRSFGCFERHLCRPFSVSLNAVLENKGLRGASENRYEWRATRFSTRAGHAESLALGVPVRHLQAATCEIVGGLGSGLRVFLKPEAK